MAQVNEEQKKCTHFTVRRIMDWWQCLKCGLEFVPKTAIGKRIVKGGDKE
jgi:ribosomal protein L37AE/L43A